MGLSRKFYLREWRRYRGLSQDKLAELVETSKGYLSQIERGERPYSQKWLEQLAAALDINPEDLISNPPPALADKARTYGEADKAGRAAKNSAPFDPRLMEQCIETAVQFIVARRDLRTAEGLARAADDVADAAIQQYLTYFRLINDENQDAP